MSISCQSSVSWLDSPGLFRLVERHESGIAKDWERRYWRKIARLELITGRVPLTSKLRLPVVGTRTG